MLLVKTITLTDHVMTCSSCASNKRLTVRKWPSTVDTPLSTFLLRLMERDPISDEDKTNIIYNYMYRDWLTQRTVPERPSPVLCCAGLTSLHEARPCICIGNEVLIVGVVLVLTYILLLVVRFRVRRRNAVLIGVLHQASGQCRRHFTYQLQRRVNTTFSEVRIRHQARQRLQHARATPTIRCSSHSCTLSQTQPIVVVVAPTIRCSSHSCTLSQTQPIVVVVVILFIVRAATTVATVAAGALNCHKSKIAENY